MIYLEQAIYNKLTADVELVALTQHTATAPRIFAGYPDKVAKYPCIAFWYETSVNQSTYIDEIESTTFNFGVFVNIEDSVTYNGWTLTGQLLCKRILDKLTAKFKPGNMTFLDFSDNIVKTDSVLFINRLVIRFEEEIEIYRGDVVIEINWYHK